MALASPSPAAAGAAPACGPLPSAYLPHTSSMPNLYVVMPIPASILIARCAFLACGCDVPALAHPITHTRPPPPPPPPQPPQPPTDMLCASSSPVPRCPAFGPDFLCLPLVQLPLHPGVHALPPCVPKQTSRACVFPALSSSICGRWQPGRFLLPISWKAPWPLLVSVSARSHSSMALVYTSLFATCVPNIAHLVLPY